MRKSTILLASLFAVCMTTAADAAAKKKASAPDPAAASREQTRMLVGDALQPWQPQRAAPGAKKAKKKRG